MYETTTPLSLTEHSCFSDGNPRSCNGFLYFRPESGQWLVGANYTDGVAVFYTESQNNLACPTDPTTLWIHRYWDGTDYQTDAPSPIDVHCGPSPPPRAPPDAPHPHPPPPDSPHPHPPSPPPLGADGSNLDGGSASKGSNLGTFVGVVLVVGALIAGYFFYKHKHSVNPMHADPAKQKYSRSSLSIGGNAASFIAAVLSPRVLQLPLPSIAFSRLPPSSTGGLESVVPPTDKASSGAHPMLAQSASAMQLDALGPTSHRTSGTLHLSLCLSR